MRSRHLISNKLYPIIRNVSCIPKMRYLEKTFGSWPSGVKHAWVAGLATHSLVPVCWSRVPRWGIVGHVGSERTADPADVPFGSEYLFLMSLTQRSQFTMATWWSLAQARVINLLVFTPCSVVNSTAMAWNFIKQHIVLSTMATSCSRSPV